MPNPTTNPVVLLSPVENGYVAYDPVSDRLHHLNPVAALIAELCDGSRSIDDIRELAGPLMPEGKMGEVDRWIDDAMKVGLLTWQGSESANRRELSAAELYTLAKRLKQSNKVQTAYLCGKRVVELKPDDWDAWYDLGEICQCVNRREEARAAYQKYFEAHPEDAEIEHLLVALRADTPPPRSSDRAIQQIYKGFAASYASRMLEDLKYHGPERLARAAKREIYDRLEVGEITEWLEKTAERFDLIASCDCIIYFGDLHHITAAAAKRLNLGGIFALSMERGQKY